MRLISRSRSRFIDEITCAQFTWALSNLDRSAASYIYICTVDMDFNLWHYWTGMNEQYYKLMLV